MKYDDGCGRYALQTKADQLKKRYNLATQPPEFTESFDVSPGQLLPVITAGTDGKPEARLMKWGLIPAWSKDPKMGYRLFNSRDDSVFKSPIWRNLIRRRRALVPATGFFEWTKPEPQSKLKKQKFYIHPRQIKIFSFAGVWDSWRDVENKEWQTYSIITTEPNQEMGPVHNRMPVILHQEDETAWLKPSRVEPEEIEPFLRPLEDDGLEIYEVSSDVKGLEFNDPSRIAPLPLQ